jgi:hypothetical protein
MLVRRIAAGIAALCLALAGSAQPARVRIADQAAFDSLDVTIHRFLEGDGEELDISLGPGPFFFRDGHLRLDAVDASGKRISLAGGPSLILPAMVRAPFDPDACRFVSGGSAPEPVREVRTLKRTRSFVRVMDRRNGICRIRTDSVQDPSLVRDGYIYLTQWYKGATYKITAVKGRYLFFHADDLRQVRLLYSVNLDWTFAMRFPRYRILHGEGKEWRHAVATTFLSLDHASLDGITLSGLDFIGNAKDGDRTLIQVDSSSAPVRMTGCRFEQIRSDCISVSLSQDVTVEDCTFKDCYRCCMTVSPGSSRIDIARNRIESSGLAGENSTCFRCYAADFRIRDNIISDFGYSAILTGLHYTLKKEYPLNGVISGNEIFQTPACFASAPEQLLMDSGAIYISTQNDDLLIEDNYIHDINGPTYNRGIFADDGASHIRIVRNRIKGMGNYYAIDVDPRSAWKMLHRRKRRVNVANEGVVVRDNVVDGKVRIARMRKTNRRLRDQS